MNSNEQDTLSTAGDSLTTEKISRRTAKTFIPAEDDELNQVPESITAGERLPNVPEYTSISLKALPLTGIKSFVYGFGILLFSLFAWEVFTVVKSALEIHWLLAAVFISIILIVVAFGVRFLWCYLRDQDNHQQLESIQAKALHLSNTTDMGNGQDLISDLKAFYYDKPQSLYLQRAVEKVPDYSNDREVVSHIDNLFVQPLDEEALRRISNYSLQTGLAVALSPWASLDMLLSLWRSLKMIDSIAEVYGTRPSLLNRYRLLKSVIHQLAFVAISDLMVESLIEESAKASLVGAASTRLGQGLGAGIYSVKIGIAAMNVSRPIAFTEKSRPRLKAVISPMLNSLKARLSGV